jgi:hypothetical protein
MGKKGLAWAQGPIREPGEGLFFYITRAKYDRESNDSVVWPTGGILRFGDFAGARETSKLQTP